MVGAGIGERRHAELADSPQALKLRRGEESKEQRILEIMGNIKRTLSEMA